MLNQLRNMEPLKEILFQYDSHLHAGRVEKLFYRKVPVYFEKGSYVVKTIENRSELKEVMKLRYQVFHKEYRKKKFPFGLDVESLDPVADHLVIIDKVSNRIVGTYRLICSEFSNVFYSQSEFRIQGFFELPGVKLEMSRACIHRDFRKGVVMNLLWRGLVKYMNEVKAKYLFGCSSVKTMDPREVSLVVERFQTEGQVIDSSIQAQPLPMYEMTRLAVASEEGAISKTVDEMIPALLQSYLKAGAKVAPVPALDRDFKCVDFFTVLDVDSLTQLYERRYKPD